MYSCHVPIIDHSYHYFIDEQLFGSSTLQILVDHDPYLRLSVVDLARRLKIKIELFSKVRYLKDKCRLSKVCICSKYLFMGTHN